MAVERKNEEGDRIEPDNEKKDITAGTDSFIGCFVFLAIIAVINLIIFLLFKMY